MSAMLLDLEGTLVDGKAFTPIAGSAALVEALRQSEWAVRVVTNNTTDMPAQISEKLSALGIRVAVEEITSPLGLLSGALPGAGPVMVIGSDALKSEVRRCGHDLVDSDIAKAVVIGGGGKIDEIVLSSATRSILDSGARLIGLHKNRLYVDGHGLRTVGVGAVISALEYATNTDAIIIGKPSRYCFEQALVGTECDFTSSVMVSDDPYSDLEGAREIGIKTVFVTTGKYAADEITRLSWRPNLVCGTLADLESRLVDLA